MSFAAWDSIVTVLGLVTLPGMSFAAWDSIVTVLGLVTTVTN